MTLPFGYVTPLVAARARRAGVDLAKVTGSGENGRVLMTDVEAAAARRPRSPENYLAPNSTSSRSRPTLMQTRDSWFDRDMSFQRAWGKQVRVNAFAANPLADDLKQADPTTFNQAVSRSGAPPTLFEAGDLPIFTATGFDPAELVRLPWMARHTAATSSDTSTVQQVFERCGATDLDAAVSNAWALGMGDRGNANYIARLTGWATATAMPSQIGL